MVIKVCMYIHVYKSDLHSINAAHSSTPLQQEGEDGVWKDDGLQRGAACVVVVGEGVRLLLLQHCNLLLQLSHIQLQLYLVKKRNRSAIDMQFLLSSTNHFRV